MDGPRPTSYAESEQGSGLYTGEVWLRAAGTPAKSYKCRERNCLQFLVELSYDPR